MARKFLYIIAGLIVLVIIAGFALRIWSKELTRLALVPTTEFEQQDPLAANAYNDPKMWFARPGMEGENPARWQPQLLSEAEEEPEEEGMLSGLFDDEDEGEASSDAQANAGSEPDDAEPGDANQSDADQGGSNQGQAANAADGADGADPAQSATASADSNASPLPEELQDPGDYAVFFLHPTSYLSRASWNAPLDDAKSQKFAKLYVRGLASPFNQASEIWAPRYRQATIGAFLTDQPEAQMALDLAYSDVRQAFEFFLAKIDKDRPIVLVGHSQGALHLLTMLKQDLAGSPDAKRIAAFYAIGWPISAEKDLPSLGLPACQEADQPGCIMSWSSFAEPADPGDLLEAYKQSIAYDGTQRGDSPIVCTNPITGIVNGSAMAEQNLGTLVPEDDLSTGFLVPQIVPAKCDAQGLLLIGDPPEMGSAVLPGNNYHVYDIPLFWSNLQYDVNMRVKSWHQAN